MPSMRPTMRAFLGLLTLAAHFWAQAASKPVYVESFRKGPTRVAELLLVANLTTQDVDYKATIKHFKGNDRFQLSLEPSREEGGAENYAIVPLQARRVFKVEDFYCVIQGKDFHVMPENHLPDSMTVEVRFTGIDPRQN